MPPDAAAIPLLVKFAYSAYLCVLVPTYWINYGPTNFLYFCDVALFLTLAGMWTEAPLPVGMAAVGIVLPQLIWVADFIGGSFGRHITGLSAYMFDRGLSPFLRALSLFHGWLPFLLLWLLSRLGYDPRSLPYWTGVAWGLMLISYLWLPAPPAPRPNIPANVNNVFGPGDAVQTWMPRPAWLLLVMILFPLCLYLPTHLILMWLYFRPG